MSVEKQAHGLDQACPRVAHTPQTSDIFIQRLVQVLDGAGQQRSAREEMLPDGRDGRDGVTAVAVQAACRSDGSPSTKRPGCR